MKNKICIYFRNRKHLGFECNFSLIIQDIGFSGPQNFGQINNQFFFP
jgi:hypothetical protein